MEFTPKNRHLLTCQTWEPSKECLTHSCRPRPLSRPLSVVLQKPTVIATSIWMKVKLIIASFVVECDSWMFVYCMSHVDYDIHIYNYIIYIYIYIYMYSCLMMRDDWKPTLSWLSSIEFRMMGLLPLITEWFHPMELVFCHFEPHWYDFLRVYGLQDWTKLANLYMTLGCTTKYNNTWTLNLSYLFGNSNLTGHISGPSPRAQLSHHFECLPVVKFGNQNMSTRWSNVIQCYPS